MKSARFHGISEVVFELREDLGNQVSGENELRFATGWASHLENSACSARRQCASSLL